MTEDYVSYPIALKLKKAGFDEPCDHYYARKGIIGNKFKLTEIYRSFSHQNSTYSTASAPTLWQAQKWLREVKRIEVNASWESIKRYWFFYTNLMDVPDIVNLEDISDSVYSTYEQALSAGITSALELIENEKE